ncbi:MAG TPA: hypothetical protein VFE36_04505 [Candidatus Baltobacteraceae bacterium]|jgi:hypothetical protein|nr:hypothetical protein [Candidatus Baltobacteraceae bacterium]
MAIRSNAKGMMEAFQATIDDWQKRKVDPVEYQYVVGVTQTYTMIEILYQLETLNAKSRI